MNFETVLKRIINLIKFSFFYKIDENTGPFDGRAKSFYYFIQNLDNFSLPSQTKLDAIEKQFNQIGVDTKSTKYIYFVFWGFISLFFIALMSIAINVVAERGLSANNIINGSFTIFILMTIYILIGYQIWILVKSALPTEDFETTIKQIMFELIRQEYNFEKIIYLTPNFVQQTTELDLIKELLGKYGPKGTVEISEVAAILIEKNTRPFLLADVKFTASDSLKTVKHFLVFLSKNPDEHFGNTASFSNPFWKINFGSKVATESLEFDRKFNTLAEDQIEARLALKTNVMNDMINLENYLPGKNLFYFHNEAFIICIEKDVDPFEVYGFVNFNNISSSARNVYKDLNLGISIFVNFWLNRKSWKG